LTKDGFHAIAGFPSDIFAVEGTHIRIIAPHNYEQEMPLKMTNGVGLKKGKNKQHKPWYLNIHLTQMTENF